MQDALATVAPSDIDAIRGTQAYQGLLADCREIVNSARVAVLEYMWHLGERISKDIDPADERSQHQINLALEQDLSIDRTTLVRAIQTYQRFRLPEICDGSSQLITWGKLRMLLPLPDMLFDQIWKRIISGELRTDEQVRFAILALKADLGLDRPALGEPRYQLELELGGMDANKPLRVLWGKATPIDRIHLATELMGKAQLDKADRGAALKALQYARQRIEGIERRLGGASR